MDRFILITLLCALITPPALGQQVMEKDNNCDESNIYEGVDTTDTESMDPQIATLINAAVPGGAHLMAEEYGKGSILLGSYITAPIIGAIASDFNGAFWGEGDPNIFPFVLGIGVSIGSWLYAIFDADNAANRYNEKMKRSSLSIDFEDKRTGLTEANISIKPKYNLRKESNRYYGFTMRVNF